MESSSSFLLCQGQKYPLYGGVSRCTYTSSMYRQPPQAALHNPQQGPDFFKTKQELEIQN